MHFEARFAGARAAALRLGGASVFAPMDIVVRPGTEPAAATMSPEEEPGRTSVLRRTLQIVEPRILMPPSAAEFASVQVSGEIAVVPAKRGIREELEKARPSLIVIPHLHLIEEGRTLADMMFEVRTACPAAAVVAPGCGQP
ncbi:MAG TPA: hypothetical protein VI893_08145, partial [Thermoplasmata archaeon]|nr:hypothetical protein [Thermoplasmata archaeon]